MGTLPISGELLMLAATFFQVSAIYLTRQGTPYISGLFLATPLHNIQKEKLISGYIAAWVAKGNLYSVSTPVSGYLTETVINSYLKRIFMRAALMISGRGCHVL